MAGPALKKLTGRVVAVTGAAGDIGFHIAKRLASEDATVILLGRKIPELQSNVHKIKETTGNEAHYMHLDVTNAQHWRDLAREQPKIQYLVNCAGISQTDLLPKTSPDGIQTVLRTNLEGAILGSKFIGRNMIQRLRGTDESGQSQVVDKCIVNVSSLLARKGVAGAAVYAASKAGLIGLTTSLAVEYARWGIRSNVVLPGYIATKMTSKNLFSPFFGRPYQHPPHTPNDIHVGAADELVSQIPAGRFGKPEEVADAVSFLINNQYANNCILNLDGGLSAR
ncbi:hypothetical protein OQA88_12715 [Cercophora sp. LCS_1]